MRSPPQALAVLSMIVWTSSATAQEGDAGPGPTPPEPAAPVATAPAPRLERPARLYLAIGYDIGGARLVEVILDDGTRPSIRANGGFSLAAGAELLPALGGRLWTRATAGLKYDAVNASNGKVSYLAFPLELAELFSAGPVRLGAGLSLSLAPRLSGSGVAAGIGESFDPSLGALLLAEWFWQAGRPGSGFGLGASFLWQRLRTRTDGIAVGASTLGLRLSWIP